MNSELLEKSELSNKEIFDMILRDTNREGIEELIKYLESTDFYTAPASSRFHCDYEGGLVSHSLNAYTCLVKKKKNELWRKYLRDTPDESFALARWIIETKKHTMKIR